MSQKLTYEECIKIQVYLEDGLKHRPIAKKLKRSNSSISDEIRKYSVKGRYIASIAWTMRYTKRRLINILHYKIQRGDPLDTFIVEKIKQYRSPEQVAGRRRREMGEVVSKDTIYSHIKRNHPELIKAYFRRRGKKYKYGTIKAGYILERKSIHERPLAAKYKTEIGHWEGDTVRGSRNTGGFVTFTERKSGFELVRIIGQKYASIVTEATRQLFETIPQKFKKTVTLDNGKEFVEHYMRKCLCGLDTYFADIGNAGQRGLNENTNGLLRQFYPKKMSLSNVSQKEVDYYVDLLNNRPRKRNNYLTPKEVLKTYCADLN